jgi:hypothetical protein
LLQDVCVLANVGTTLGTETLDIGLEEDVTLVVVTGGGV